MAPSSRPVWSGQIRLALVALPVKLYSAVESGARVAFHQIHQPTGSRIRYAKVVPGVGEVESDDIVKGVEVQKGRHVLISDEEIDALKVESKRTLDLVQFVDVGEIDELYFDRPYFATPDGALAEEPYRVVREALRRSRRAGLGLISMRGRSALACVKPCGKGLLVETLRFESELRRSGHFFDSIPDAAIDPDLIGLADELIARKTAPFDPGRFKDEYAEAVEKLIAAKIEGQGAAALTEEAPRERGAEVVSLVEALRRSLGSDAKPKAPAPRRAPKSAAPRPRRKRA